METNHKRVLFIEDDFYIAEIFQFALEESGFTVILANDGEKGLEALASDNYDIVLLDIMLPKINGIEILRKCFAPDFPKKNLNIILLSNLAQENIIKEGLKLGAKEFILKDQMLPKELAAKVAETLAVSAPE